MPERCTRAVAPLLAAAWTAHGAVPPAAFQRDPVEEYGSRLLTGILVAGIGLVLYSLVRYRGRAEGHLSWSILTAGLVVLPTIAVGFGSLLVFQRAERVDFCGSCHLAMQAYVDDMANPNSESLAAVHYKNRYIAANQCYTCHTSFGMFGTVEAKIAGLVDVHKYYTGSFASRIRMREPYRNDDCLKCHAGSIRWNKHHTEVRELIHGGRLTCLECHGEKHPAHNVARRGQPEGPGR